jgi:4-amino-4-deoxy-L-arabinose transferase-like glycosyltransferase
MTALGAGLRLWGVHRLGLSHFDEGMYAMAAFWVAQPAGFVGIDPSAALYAPPLYHLGNGLAYLLMGYSDLSLIVTSLAAGVAAIPLAGWVARRAFGPGAGSAAAALAALSGAGVAFSRMALTDSLFLATWLLAMGLGLRFLQRPGLGRGLALGLAVGLAQNTKYNGWLAGVIVGGAGLLGLWPGGDRRMVRRLLVGLAVAAGVSALCYLPWYRFVESHGGYDALIAHQRGYLGRLDEWPGHLRMQLGAITALAGGRSWLAAAWGLAALGTGWAWRARPEARRLGWLALAGAAFVALPSLAWWIGLAWLPWLLRSRDPGPRLLGVWWLVLSLMTPLYHPYARLWLPLHAAGWVLLGGAMARWASGAAGVAPIPLERRGVRAGLMAVAVAAALVAFVPRPARVLDGLLSPTDFVRHDLLTADLGSGRTREGLLKVLARPHAAFYLFLDGRSFRFQKVGTLDQLVAEASPEALALVDEAQLRQAGDPEAARAKLAAVMEPVPGAERIETLSPVTLLDVAPEAAFGDLRARPCRWQVWRVKRASPGAGGPR